MQATTAVPEFDSPRPQLALTSRPGRVRAQVAERVESLYDAGANTRRTVGWRAPTVSSNQALLANLTTLRDRSRAATRNDGYAKGVIDKLVTNVIGTGIQPLSQAADPAFRRALQALWLQWTDESDADGLLDYYGQQTQAVRTWFEGGEAFTRLRPRLPEDGLSVPLQIQVLEPELCPHTHTVWSATARIRAGIEFNPIGKRVAYWFHPSRPEIDDFDASTLRRVPATSVQHLYDPLRPGQLRGLPLLVQALIALYELDKYDDASLLKQQLANLFVAFVTRTAPIVEPETVHPLTGLPVDRSVDDAPMLVMEPGIFQELNPGEDVKWSTPPAVDAAYPDFMRQQLLGVSAATGVPYEVLTGDMSKVNDRTVRVILNEFRRRITAWQHQIVVFQVCRPHWQAWMDQVFLSGALPIPLAYLDDPSPWAAVEWQPQGWPYINPTQDVQAQREAVRSGFKSRTRVVSEQGDSAAVIDAEQEADNTRADELRLRYDSDGRTAATPTAAAMFVPEPKAALAQTGAPA
jgi:lambda family phage portal protein